MHRSRWALALSCLCLAACARGSGGGGRTESDAGPRTDATIDSGTDSGTPDPDRDAGPDPLDSGPGDSGPGDSGPGDAGPGDAGPGDSGPVDGGGMGGCTALPATGSLALMGTTTGGPTWERPLATTCPATGYSASGTAVPYATHVLCNEGASGTFDLRVSGSISDSYLVVYDGSAIPADDLACIEGDDDSGGSSQALVTGLPVTAGQRITVVVSGFDNADFGAYTLTLTRL